MPFVVVFALLALACDPASPAMPDQDAAGDEPPDAGLPDAAVVDASVVDAGEREHAELTRFTPLAVGSAECPFGGRRVETGHDDGDGDGTADDGVLSDGEVELRYEDCDNDIPDPNDAIEPPAGPAGSALVDLRGGGALAGALGGAGGHFRAEAVGGNPCIAELTRVFPTGELVFEPAELAASAAQGLHVAPGASTVLDSDITLEGDIVVEGTLGFTGDGPRSLEGRSLHVTSTGRIEAPHGVTLRGRERVVFEGTLEAKGADVTLSSGAGAWLRGRIDVSGVDGGPGGSITVRALDAELVSLAELRADGADGVESAGDGGRILVQVAAEDVGTLGVRLALSGTLSARGGAASGATGQGGAGGTLRVSHCLPAQSVVELLGYQAIELGGGAGTGQAGGAAGSLTMALDFGVGESRRLALHVPVRAAGGAGHASGRGGALEVDFLGLDAQLSHDGFPVLKHAWPSWIPSVLLGADVVLDAGASGEGGSAAAGHARVRAPGKLEVRGALLARGGASSGGSAGAGGSLALQASNELTMRGLLTANGAAGGGPGGCVSLAAPTLDVTGMLSAQGSGAADGQVLTDGTSCPAP
jgi:hypothetical protein